MELDDLYNNPSQPTLFDFGDSSQGVAELFPAVWHLCEGAISPELSIRRSAVEQIIEVDAARLLPLVAYILATRITETDLDTRTEVIAALGDILLPDKDGLLPSESVRHSLTVYLAEMRTRQIYALLQVLPNRPDLEKVVARLLNACPYAGNQLAEILTSRRVPMDIRRHAVRLVGLVGYLDAIPALERLLARLESRLHGQQSMSFAPVDMVEDAVLIPDIRRALAFLQSP
jgi:HEAT repeat protein